MTFRLLPPREQAAVLGGIAALNAVVTYKNKVVVSTAAEITALAFAKCPDFRAAGETDHLRESIKAAARSKGWSNAEIEGCRAAEIQKSYDLNYVAAVVQMGDVLEQLVKHKRLPDRAGADDPVGGGAFVSLAGMFMQHVLFTPARVLLNEKGFAEIDVGIRFPTALGLVAWTIIRLSQLRAHGHVILRCAECREFKIASIRKPQRFCKPAHRNLYNVHLHRSKARARKAK